MIARWPKPAYTPAWVLHLQRSLGNRAIFFLLGRQRRRPRPVTAIVKREPLVPAAPADVAPPPAPASRIWRLGDFFRRRQ